MISKESRLSREFSIDLWHGALMDQKRSGRCWIYASMNALRQKIVERYGLEDFLFSTNYIYYFDQLEKSGVFLERMAELRDVPLSDPELSNLLRSPISSVGQWSYCAVLAQDYGLVPLSAMPDTAASEDGTRLTLNLSQCLRTAARKLRNSDDIERVKTSALKDIAEILQDALGKPPKQFEWDGKLYTPHTFFREFCGVDYSGYVMLMHHPAERWPVNCAYHEEANPDRRHPCGYGNNEITCAPAASGRGTGGDRL